MSTVLKRARLLLSWLFAVEMEDTIGGDAWKIVKKLGALGNIAYQSYKIGKTVNEVFTDFADRPLTTPLRGDGSYPSSLNAEGVRGTPFYSGD